MSFVQPLWRTSSIPRRSRVSISPLLLSTSRVGAIQNTRRASSKAKDQAPSNGDVKREIPSDVKEQDQELTGAAKLMAEALVEEESMKAEERWRERGEKLAADTPVWTGEESTKDAVLRMLMDSPSNRPLRSNLVQSAEEKIKNALKTADFNPRATYGSSHNSTAGNEISTGGPADVDAEPSARMSRPLSEIIQAEREISPDEFKPWMARYVARDAPGTTPSVVYGKSLISSTKSESSHLSLLDKPPGFNPNDPKHRKAWKEQRKSAKIVGRVDNAREGALDYKIGGKANQAGRAPGMASMRAWEGLIEERIQQARQAGWFDNVKGRGKPITEDPDLLHMDRTEFHLNRIMKRQGAKPPWIELQNELDSAHKIFRSNLLDSYTRSLVRTLVTSPYQSQDTLASMSPSELSRLRDSRWENKERAYHEELIKDLNNLTRRMNAQAPQVVRRGLVILSHELDLMYQDAGHTVAAELRKRSHDSWDKKKNVGEDEHESQERMGNGFGAFSGTWTLPKGKIGLVFAAMGGLTYIVHTTASANGRIQTSSSDQDEQGQQKDVPKIVASSLIEDESKIVPVRLFNLYIVEPLATIFRFFRLAWIFGPVILSAPMLMIGTPAASRRRRIGVIVDEGERWGAVWWFGFLVRQMEKAGPTFVKLGQWAASRSDLFPTSLCELMGKLHSNGHPHPFDYTKKVLEEAFEERFEDIFDEFEHEPIGCGAIAQVYRAKLKRHLLPDSFISKRTQHSEKDGVPTESMVNTSVAVKVVHPRVEKNIRRDLAIMSIFANALNLFPGMEWLSLPEEVDVFGGMMNMQLDLRVEADNLERFIKNFAKRGPGISFPRPIRTKGEHTGIAARKVLVEEYEDALPLKYFLTNGGGQYDDQIANAGLNAFLRMLLLDNWTHGDLHPGNIMIRFYKQTNKGYFRQVAPQFFPAPEPIDPMVAVESQAIVQRLRTIHKDPAQWTAELDRLAEEGYVPELIFIDAGLVTSLDTTNRRNFLDLFQAVAEFDGYKAGHLMAERCSRPELVLDAETFALKIQHLVLGVKSTTFSLAAIKISDILTEMLKNVRQHHVKLEGDFVNTVISILLLEGIGRTLDKDLDLLASALPILRQVGRQMGTNDAMSQVPKGNIWAMAKIWLYLEMKTLAGSSKLLDIENWVNFSSFE